MQAGSTVNDRFPSAWPLLVLGAIAWMLAHPYSGIFHDARLYTLQALAHVHPESLSQDIFLRFGSQDRFTMFSPIFAAAIRLFGPDRAAELLTFLSQMALFGGVWWLARSVLPIRIAPYAIVAIATLPLYYGPERIFSCVEEYVTPRMLAEALVLGSLAAALSSRRPLSALCMTAALLLHPVMAMAGVAALLWMRVMGERWREGVLLASLAALWMSISAWVLPAGNWGRFDAQWLALLRVRSPYVFMSDWNWEDWTRASVIGTTLIMGARSLPARAGSLCLIALLTVLTGWLLTLVMADGLHLVLITQLQPWRWQWLANSVAALSLPALLYTLWSRDLAGRATAMLLAAAWTIGVDTAAFEVCVVALGSLLLTRWEPRYVRLIVFGSAALLVLAVVWNLVSTLQFTAAHYMEPSLPQWWRRSISFVQQGSIAFLLIGTIAVLWHTVPRTVSVAMLPMVVLASWFVVPFAWRTWSQLQYPDAFVNQFASWRALVPTGTDVFWVEAPTDSWLILDRPNYLSRVQAAGVLFSRATALEIERRALLLSSVIEPESFLGWSQNSAGLKLSSDSYRAICRLKAVDFIVTATDLNFPPAAALQQDSSNHSQALKLYRCTDYALAAAAAT